MAARDRYDISVRCETCGTRGTVHVSEADQGYVKSMERQVEGVEGPITATVGENDYIVTCDGCGKQLSMFV